MDGAPDRGEDFVAGGLASLGIEADETELAVISGVHGVFAPAIAALIGFDTGELPTERAPDLSKAPAQR